MPPLELSFPPASAAIALGLPLGFGLTYLLASKVNNYGIVDVAWSYAFALCAAYALQHTPDASLPAGILASLYAVWSLRLGYHLQRRVLGHHPKEDGRYVQLRLEWKKGFAWKMFAFFQAQGLLVWLLLTPLWFVLSQPDFRLGYLQICACILWGLAFLGESIADAQLAHFKAQKPPAHEVLQTGLWRYSRHPNYFFEWLHWVAYALFALQTPWSLLGLLCPALMLHFLLNVTGLKYTEAQTLRSKGEAYQRYQKTTSAFVPLPPRKL